MPFSPDTLSHLGFARIPLGSGKRHENPELKLSKGDNFNSGFSCYFWGSSALLLISEWKVVNALPGSSPPSREMREEVV
jgi:hypothetical protein